MGGNGVNINPFCAENACIVTYIVWNVYTPVTNNFKALPDQALRWVWSTVMRACMIKVSNAGSAI